MILLKYLKCFDFDYCLHKLDNKKDSLGNPSINWIIRVGATEF